jgi:hypothetical protein
MRRGLPSFVTLCVHHLISGVLLLFCYAAVRNLETKKNHYIPVEIKRALPLLRGSVRRPCPMVDVFIPRSTMLYIFLLDMYSFPVVDGNFDWRFISISVSFC